MSMRFVIGRVPQRFSGSPRTLIAVARKSKTSSNGYRHLRAAGLDVCAPLAVSDGTQCHSLVLPSTGSTTLPFSRARKAGLSPGTISAQRLSFLHGKSLGQLHTQSAKTAGRFLTRRKRWDEERYFETDLENFIPVRRSFRYTRHLAAIAGRTPRSSLRLQPAWPRAPGSRLFQFSLRWRPPSPLLIFDNCAIGPHACDIAVALYGGLFTLLRCEFPGDRDAFDHPRTSQNLVGTLPAFQAGYESERPWREEWAAQLPLWFEFAYLRSVVHAFRMQHPVTNLQVKAALDKDVGNLLRRQPPIRFDTAASRA